MIDIQVIGNQSVSTEKVLGMISTKLGRPFDQATLEKDVRKLAKHGTFLGVRTIREQVTGGVKITFQVSERPTLAYVKYIGNEKVSDKKLAKKTELKKGAPFDMHYDIDEGKRKIEECYKEKGYNDVHVSILEGNKPGDRGAIYLINEGVVQKVWKVYFEGNTIASDGRLRTQVGSKPPLLYLFKGQVDRKKIDEDIEKLTAYYRSLGFFRARVGREIKFDENEKWATLTFVVDEGPRYVIRDVKFVGNQTFSTEELQKGVKLKAGDYFSQGNLTSDRTMLTDAYGNKGYVFCNVQNDLRFLEEPGQLDVVFNLEEGGRFAVGRIDVHIEGDNKGGNPHTRFHTVLNRLQFRPGDIMDTQKIRNAERRLKASALFVSDPQKGNPPKISFSPPDSDEETGVARRKKKNSDNVRGQSPDDEPANQPADEDPSLKPGERVSISLFPVGRPVGAALPAADPNAKSQSAPVWQPVRSLPDLPGLKLLPPAEPAPAPAEELTIRGQGPDELPWEGDEEVFDDTVIVRGQSPYGGTAIQPLSPAPQSQSAYPPQAAPSRAASSSDRFFGQSPDPNAPASRDRSSRRSLRPT